MGCSCKNRQNVNLTAAKPKASSPKNNGLRNVASKRIIKREIK